MMDRPMFDPDDDLDRYLDHVGDLIDYVDQCDNPDDLDTFIDGLSDRDRLIVLDYLYEHDPDEDPDDEGTAIETVPDPNHYLTLEEP